MNYHNLEIDETMESVIDYLQTIDDFIVADGFKATMIRTVTSIEQDPPSKDDPLWEVMLRMQKAMNSGEYENFSFVEDYLNWKKEQEDSNDSK